MTHVNSSVSTSQPPRLFPNTRWSMVLAARLGHSMESAAALEALCQTYWYPLYAFVRGSGRSPSDAQDLTQEFFARLLSKEWLRSADPEKGRFRTFLRVALKRFLADEYDRARARKRGGAQPHLPLDTELAETLYRKDSAGSATPDQLYDRHWAMTLLNNAMTRLEREYAAARKADELETLKPHLTAERGSIPYADIAVALRRSESAARVALHRLRKRFRDIFRETISDTVCVEDDVAQETRHVLDVLGRG